MIGLIVRRALVAVLLLFIISFLTFALIQATPGSYFDQLQANPRISSDFVEKQEQKFGLNDPVYVQYVRWIWNLLHGDMGHSFVHDRSVSGLIWTRFINTIFLMAVSIFLTWILAVPMGVYAAVHQQKLGDRFFSFLAFVGLSIPNFFFCFLLLYLAAQIPGWPIGGMTSSGFQSMNWWQQILDIAHHMVIPVVVIATAAMASLQRITRGNMLETLRKQYVMTARARGIPENRVVYKHALRVAVNPLISIFGMQLPTLIGGAALTEIIYSWPGMGQLLLQAVRSKDQFVVVGLVLFSGIMLIIGNILADILLAWSDPRVRFSGESA